MTIDNPDRSVTHRVEGDMSIYRAEALKRELLDALQRSDELELDLSGITEFDTTGLQLLLLLAREAHAAGKPLRLAGVGAVVAEVFGLLRLVPEQGPDGPLFGIFAGVRS